MENETPRRMPNVPPFVKFVCANVPMVFDDSLSYYEALCALWKYVQGMTDVINNNATLEEEFIEKFNVLQGKFVELKTYVDTYFDNLDVQEEIDHKLDEMVEEGTLQEIITTYIQSNVAWIFDTVADMKSSTNLIAGSYARTLGYYAIGDGGGATYKIDDTSTPNEMDIIQIGSGDLSAVLVTGSTKNVKQFGAKGDGVQDDTAYIQRALDCLTLHDNLYLPKGNKCNYIVSDTLVLTADDVTIYSEPKTEYSTRLTGTTANKTILNVIAYGTNIKNISFYGDGTSENFATIDGINFDRSSLGDDETYSNLDEVVEDCLFMSLDSCITFKGRNMRIKNNTFTQSKKGIVGLLYKYSSNTEISDFRGIYILENVFHSMNNQTNSLSGKTLATMDSFCISMPLESNKVGNIQVLNNKGEFCRSIFYCGYLVTAQINNNQWYESFSTLVYSPVEDAALISYAGSRTAQINSNIVTGTYTSYFNNNFIYVKNIHNLQLANNSFRNCSGDAIVGYNTARFVVDNNLIEQFGSTDGGHSGILIDTGACFARGNIVIGMGKGAYGITSNADVHLNNNNFAIATKALNVSGDHIKYDGSYTTWSQPTLQNSFTFDSGNNLGYRKLENGQTEVRVAVKGGTDNSVAFQLPSGYRPSVKFMIPNIILNPAQYGASAYASFTTDGNVLINWDGAVGDTTSYIIRAIFD